MAYSVGHRRTTHSAIQFSCKINLNVPSSPVQLQNALINMVNRQSYRFVWFCVCVVSVFSVTHINGLKNNYVKMFPKVGDNVTLKCSNGQSNRIIKHSEVLWRMNHKELPGRAKLLENGDLFILSFDSSDAGIYICDLAAANGYVEHAPLIEYELKPRSVPGSLLDVHVIPYSVLVLITWKEIENNGGSPILNITIRYRSVNNRISDDDWNILIIDPFKVQKEIYSLSPNTEYEIEIWASNEIGDGSKTELDVITKNEMTDIELKKRLMEGIDTFDNRAWTFAVVVIMSTFSIFGVALCCVFVKEPRIQKSIEDSEDVERIELIPNITINPGYCEA